MSKPAPDVHQLQVQGLHCASCVGRVEGALSEVAGVASAQVDLTSGRAIVRTDASLDAAQLVAAVVKAGYQAEISHGETEESQPPCCLVPMLAAVLAATAMALSMLATAPWSEHAVLALAALVVCGFGAPIFAGAARQALRLRGDMNVLVALGAGSALVTGALTVLWPAWWPVAGDPPRAMDAAAVIVAVVLVGRYLEARTRRHGAGAIQALLASAPQQATVVRQGKEWRVAIDQVVAREIVVVRSGEQVPVDGRIKEGAASFDQHMLTGESIPVDMAVGDRVAGGVLCVSGQVTLRATAVGRDIALYRIVEQVRQAQAGRPPIARVADVIAGIFVPVVLVIALATLVGWGWLGGNWSLGVANAIAVLVVACPCALGLATPAAVVAGVGRAAELGIFIRDGAVIEALASVNQIAFDKTGTLSIGRPKLHDIEPMDGFTAHELLGLAAHAEHGSTHPLARAVLAAADECGIPHNRAVDQHYHAGLGAEATIDGQHVLVGTAALMGRFEVAIGDAQKRLDALAAQGRSAFLVAVDRQLAGVLGAADEIRDDAAEAVAALQAAGLETLMLTGDHPATAEAVAQRVGIQDVHAALGPDDKAALVAQRIIEGRQIAMVGDGINDAPALTAATVGIAIGSGTAVARAAAAVTVPGHDLSRIGKSISLAHQTLAIIRQNLVLAFAYNVIAIPVAAGALVPFGLALNPMIAAVAMSLSSITVVANALRLRRAS